MSVATDIESLRLRVEKARTEVARSEGQEQAALARLSEMGYKSAAEAREAATAMRAEVYEMDDELGRRVAELKARLEGVGR